MDAPHEVHGVTHSVAEVNGIRLHYAQAGRGTLVVLLHGWPQTWYCWRKVLPVLAEHFTVVAPDLRGYGLTDKPAGGYDKRTMATDIRALVGHLGHKRILLVGHDRGGRVAHRYALDHPEEVARLAVLDIAPTRATFRTTEASVALGYWHWLFHLQPDLPELLVGNNIEAYLRFFFERWPYNRAAMEEAIGHYVRAFSAPGALRASFDDYRATIPDDLAADDANAGDKLTMPVLVLWGSHGLPARLPMLDIWREYAANVEGGPLHDCGHFLPEEQPGALAERLLAFLAPGREERGKR